MDYFNDIRVVQSGRYRTCPFQVVAGSWPDFYSLQFDRSNRIHYQVDDQPIVTMDAPVIYLTHPDRKYRFGPVHEDVDWDHAMIMVTGPRAKRLFDDGFCKLSATHMFAIHRPAECAELFDEICRIHRTNDQSRHHEAVVLIERLLSFLVDEQNVATVELPFAEEFLDLAARVEMASFEPWSFQDIAREMSMSYSHFRKLFRKHIKRSPHDFLLSARMRRAARMLQDSTRSVAEVAARCNYDDPARFSTVFKQQIGLSPRQFRNALRVGGSR